MSGFNRFFCFEGITFAVTDFDSNFFKEECEEVEEPSVDMITHLVVEITMLNGHVVPVRVFDKVDITPLCKGLSRLFEEVVKVRTDDFNGRIKYMAQYAPHLVGRKRLLSDLWDCVSEELVWHYRF